MSQKRRVHSMNWFYKNSTLKFTTTLEYYEKRSESGAFISDSMFQFAGKVVTWYSETHSIREDNHRSGWWVEWMFEPLR